MLPLKYVLSVDGSHLPLLDFNTISQDWLDFWAKQFSLNPCLSTLIFQAALTWWQFTNWDFAFVSEDLSRKCATLPITVKDIDIGRKSVARVTCHTVDSVVSFNEEFFSIVSLQGAPSNKIKCSTLLKFQLTNCLIVEEPRSVGSLLYDIPWMITLRTASSLNSREKVRRLLIVTLLSGYHDIRRFTLHQSWVTPHSLL